VVVGGHDHLRAVRLGGAEIWPCHIPEMPLVASSSKGALLGMSLHKEACVILRPA
jgi:hypothetical protein